MNMETDVDVSIRPGKWIKRGPQPECPPQPISPTRSIRDLIARINAAVDPKEKAELEAQFRAECRAYDAINPDSMPLDISSVYAEIVETLAPIASEGGVIIAPDIHFPDEITKDRWQDIHRQIIACRRSAARWLAKSRKFATDRWGEAFVDRAEQQMELALGIEHREVEHHEPDVEAMTASVCKVVTRWGKMVETVAMDKDKAQAMLDSLRPTVMLMIRKLEAIAEG